LDYIKNVRLNEDYYQERKIVNTIQAIFYIASSMIHFSTCGIILLATLNIHEFLSQKRLDKESTNPLRFK